MNINAIHTKKLGMRAFAFMLLAVIFSNQMIDVAYASLPIDYRSDFIVWYDENGCADGGSSTKGITLPGSDNVEKAMNYLMSHGFSLEQAAAGVGNMQWESGSESLNPTGSDGVAFGIVQWQGGRLDNLKKHGGDKYKDFDTQLQFVGVEFGWEQAQNGAQAGTEKGSLGPVLAARSPEEAALAWDDKYERSGDGPGSKGETARQTNARKLYEKYKNGGVGNTGTATPLADSSSGAPASAGCSGDAAGSATGKVNSEGYAFPIALGKDEVTNGKGWPCQGTCHHDGTPAFDLSKNARDDSTENTPVIAIFNGSIKSLANSYSGVQGCQTFQLVGDDGWQYWYGHIQSASVQDGAKVSAGQQVAVVGRRACTGNGSYPHLHIDRGSPKGHYGGSVCCRDSGMVPLINQLYDELGGGGATNL